MLEVNKLTKSQRELFCNLKAFLYTKAKNFTPIQDVKGLNLSLKVVFDKTKALFIDRD
ncbi:hypothetical protein HSHS1_12760 [Helicobacter suis HS1]|uniref:hypothetical protein n=1 Tax=Helicobacter suis TaxID=104628 RepID=UPI00220BF4AE|nr:hypothetical protein HSHS1_12760 [Helicobacter suis HS1]